MENKKEYLDILAKANIDKYKIDMNKVYECEMKNQIPKIVESKVFGKWVVDIDGGMDYNERYYLEPNQVIESDTIIHLSEKSWIDWNEFIPALLQSSFNQGKKEIKILTKY